MVEINVTFKSTLMLAKKVYNQINGCKKQGDKNPHNNKIKDEVRMVKPIRTRINDNK